MITVGLGNSVILHHVPTDKPFMRIRGLVKASNRVRDQLKVGIPSQEVSAFQQYVAGTIQATEQICAQAKIRPSQLPVPSRNAYQFLKGVNLKGLPIVETPSTPASSPMGQKQISIQGIRRQYQYFQDRIAKLPPADTGAEKQADSTTRPKNSPN